ncbi:hypothetical protein Ddc_03864 [Ditylenchus destructor]|nr:hypothetical protein Ddc_03864 [Ditylenchus destructor]
MRVNGEGPSINPILLKIPKAKPSKMLRVARALAPKAKQRLLLMPLSTKGTAVWMRCGGSPMLFAHSHSHSSLD